MGVVDGGRIEVTGSRFGWCVTNETHTESSHFITYQMNGGFSGTSLPWDRVLSLPGVIRLHARAGVALSESQRCEDKRLDCGRGESCFQSSLIVASLFFVFLWVAVLSSPSLTHHLSLLPSHILRATGCSFRLDVIQVSMLLIPESVLYLCATIYHLTIIVSRNAGYSVAEYGYNNKIFAGVS